MENKALVQDYLKYVDNFRKLFFYFIEYFKFHHS